MRSSVLTDLFFKPGLQRSCVIRQRMRRASLQLVENRIADALCVPPQMRIPEPQRLDAARLQKLFPLCVMFPLVEKSVLAAVQFHMQFRLLAEEIEIIIADGMLTTEFVAGESSVAQPTPHEFFRPRFFLRRWRARSMSATVRI